MEKLIDYCVHNRIVTYALFIMLFLLGVFFYFKLPVRALPNFDTSEIYVVTNYLNATPQFVEQAITIPLENSISKIHGINTIRSLNERGASHIHITLKPGTSINQTLQNVQNAIAQVRHKLPQNATSPVVQNLNLSNANAVMMVGISNPHWPTWKVDQYVKAKILPALNGVPGTGTITQNGEQQAAIRLNLKPAMMEKYGITTDQLIAALASINIYTAGGQISNQQQSTMLFISPKPDTLQDFAHIIVANPGTIHPITLGEVASIHYGTLDQVNTMNVDGHPGTSLLIEPDSTSDSVILAKRLTHKIDQLRAHLPSGMKISMLINYGRFVNNMAWEVYKAIIIAIVLVAVIIFLFLGSLRLVVMPLITIPLCLSASCLLLFWFGFSLNMMTLLAIVLSIGLVVDDAIVVIENILQGKLPKNQMSQYVTKRTTHIAVAVIAMTLTLAIVYAPLGLLKGFIGNLIQPFALMLALIVLFSGVISITLTPTMAAHLFTANITQSKGFLRAERLFGAMTQRYHRAISWCLCHKKWVVLAALCFLAIGIWQLSAINKRLVPASDYDTMVITVNLPSNSSPDTIRAALQPLGNYLSHQSAVKHYYLSTDFNDADYSAVVFLKPVAQRQQSVSQLANRFTQQMNQHHSAATYYAFPASNLNIGGSGRRFELVVTTTASNAALYQDGIHFLHQADALPSIKGAELDLNYDTQGIHLVINKPLARLMGVSVADIARAVSVFYGGYQAENAFNYHGFAYPIVVMLSPEQRHSLAALSHVLVRSQSNGHLYPASFFVHATYQAIAPVLERFNGQTATRINGFIMPGFSTSSVMAQLSAIASHLPKADGMAWSGPSKNYLEASGNLMAVLLVALIIIYLVLTIQFKSVIDPLVILLTVPFAFFGAIIVLHVVGASLNIYTRVGLLTLIGLIAKHGILIVDFANLEKAAGKSIQQAVINAATKRFRPILMTTLAMALGALPLVFLHNEGSVILREIGWTLFAGLLFGSLFSLFLVPVAYSLLEGLRHYWSRS